MHRDVIAAGSEKNGKREEKARSKEKGIARQDQVSSAAMFYLAAASGARVKAAAAAGEDTAK